MRRLVVALVAAIAVIGLPVLDSGLQPAGATGSICPTTGGSGYHCPEVDVAIEKTASESVVDVGDQVTYTLEVSSPGFDRVLRTKPHFDRFVGERVFVELKVPREGRKRYTGMLRAVADEGIEIEVDRQMVAVPFVEIGKARLAPLEGGQR